MGWQYSNMMAWMGRELSLFGAILYLVVIVDLVLLGFWLWKRTGK